MTTRKTEIKWAIIFFFTTLVWMWLEKIAGLHSVHYDKHYIVTNLFAVPAILIYVLALLDKRKNAYGGVMTYKQGVVTGLTITLIVTLLSPLSQYIVSAVITPGYFSVAIDYAISEGKMTLEEAQASFNMRNYITQTLIFTPVMGIVTTLIVAIFTRRKAV
ncbi:MAG: DUF4199 domain-containing protein [Bacteroidales bacterium]